MTTDEMISIIENVKRDFMPGDVFNCSNDSVEPLLYKAVDNIVIQTQKAVGFKNTVDYHSRIYFSPFTSLSVQPVRPVFDGLNNILFTGETISVYRYIKTPINVDKILEMAEKIVYSKRIYNIGLLLDDLINTYIGNANKNDFHVFDFGNLNFDCSAGVALCYDYALSGDGLPTLFQKYNMNDFNKKHIKGPGWDIKNTFPCMFANSGMFDNEFMFVGKYINGVKQ